MVRPAMAATRNPEVIPGVRPSNTDRTTEHAEDRRKNPVPSGLNLGVLRVLCGSSLAECSLDIAASNIGSRTKSRFFLGGCRTNRRRQTARHSTQKPQNSQNKPIFPFDRLCAAVQARRLMKKGFAHASLSMVRGASTDTDAVPCADSRSAGEETVPRATC